MPPKQQPSAEAALHCTAHGPLVRHGEGWVCVGFDGEAAGWCTAGPVSDEAAARLVSGQTRWPGVTIGVRQ